MNDYKEIMLNGRKYYYYVDDYENTQLHKAIEVIEHRKPNIIERIFFGIKKISELKTKYVKVFKFMYSINNTGYTSSTKSYVLEKLTLEEKTYQSKYESIN